MRNKALRILLILAFIKGIVWMVMTPIFQVPDEASHFSIIQIIAETGQRPHSRRGRQSPLEVLKVSEIINFDWQIKHPVWQGYQADWRQQISQLSLKDQSTFIRNPNQQSLKRPPLYYWLATPFYLLVKNQSFLFRFFSVRFFSVLISLVIIWVTYQLSQIIFKSKQLSLATASLVAFQPMLSFISSGAHYDPLAVLIASFFLYFAILYLKSPKKKYLHLSLITVFLGLTLKPDLIILLFFYPFIFPKHRLRSLIIISLLVVAFLLIAPYFFQIVFQINHPYWDKLLHLINLNEYLDHSRFFYQSLLSGQLINQIKIYSIVNFKTHFAQTFPWYWGVFGWLESTMPLWVYRIIKLIILISLLGWLKLLITRRSELNLSIKKIKALLVLFSFSLIHLGLVVLNDFRVFTYSGHVFGIQGRYLLPAIVPHMILLTFGFTQLIAKKYHPHLAKLIIFSSIILNLIGLHSLYQYFGNVWL